MPTLSERARLRGLVLEAFSAFAVHDCNLPHWWARSDTERFVDRLTDRIAALSSPIGGGVREGVIEAVAAAMLNGGDGAEGDFGWNITALNKLRPLLRSLASTPTDRVGIQ